MEITEFDINQQFQEIKTVSDLAKLLNKIPYLENTSTSIKPILAKHLILISIHRNKGYFTFSIPKKNGKLREINAPNPFLKKVQSLLNKLLQIVFADNTHKNKSSNGFLPNKSIITNAKPHLNKQFVYNLDLENFFPSVEFRRIKTVLELKPFNLNSKKREKLAFIIANIVTYNGVLPQGSPTSPIISNIVTQRLDKKISRYCRKRKIRYTRYADDLTFSCNKDVFTDMTFLEGITEIIKQENFKINGEKTRLKTSRDRQQVTGLIVNRKLNVKREFIRKVRAMLYNWEKKGLEFATNRFLQENTKTDAKSFKNSLRGNIDFIGLVRGKDDKLYIKYKNKFELLQNCIDYSTISHIRVRKKLTEDNKKMERIIFDKVLSQNDKFISFCTTAFHQIENLLRYYYWERFARKIKCFKAFYVAENLESEIQKSNIVLTNEQIEEKRESIENQIQNRKTIKDIQVNSFVTLFEKEFYLDKQKKSYKNIAFLKDIRNDDSHRCSFFSIDEESILKKGKEIKESCIKFKKRKKREKKLPENEKEILEQVKFIHFVHQQNYKIVRRTLFNVLDKITIRLAELGRNQMDT